MDGVPLYDYARKGIPLPRPIEKRQITVHSIELVEWRGNDHPYRWPDKVFSAEQKQALARSLSNVDPPAVSGKNAKQNDMDDTGANGSGAEGGDEDDEDTDDGTGAMGSMAMSNT